MRVFTLHKCFCTQRVVKLHVDASCDFHYIAAAVAAGRGLSIYLCRSWNRVTTADNNVAVIRYYYQDLELSRHEETLRSGLSFCVE